MVCDRRIILNTVNNKNFQLACEKIIGKERIRKQIGTLSEKTVHAVLKNYYEPNEEFQEIQIEGKYADIFNGKEIVEIQTRNFDKLRDKLKCFLALYPVTIILPIPEHKWIYWINPDTGELSEKRKSPKKGKPYEGFLELYKIKAFLKDPNLRIKFVLMDIEEYKLLNGWSYDKKKGSCRYDRIPLSINQEFYFEEPKDYMMLLPDSLPTQFTSKELRNLLKIPDRICTVFLNILTYLEVVIRVGKKGNAYIYEVSKY